MSAPIDEPAQWEADAICRELGPNCGSPKPPIAREIAR